MRSANKILFLVISLLFTTLLFGCAKQKYPPVESSEKESEVMIKLNIEGSEYEVKYELYRALFLNNKALIDGGDDSVWTSPDADKYITEINEIIIAKASEIYSVLHLSKEIGFDPYSEKADLQVEEYIIGAVEGDAVQIGHGSYEAYLESLKKNNLNYSVADLLLRYALASDAIDKYYLGEYDQVRGQQDGEYKYTKDDVKNYYYSDDCARILQAYFQTGVKNAEQMEEYRTALLGFSDEKKLAAYIIGSTSATESDLLKDGELSGIIIGKSELVGSEYDPYITSIFALQPGELSRVVKLENTTADGYYLFYGLEKTDEHFDAFYSVIRNSYLDNIVGKVLNNMCISLKESAVFTDSYNEIAHNNITME